MPVSQQITEYLATESMDDLWELLENLSLQLQKRMESEQRDIELRLAILRARSRTIARAIAEAG